MAYVIFGFNVPDQKIDLTDYGHDANVTWNELTSIEKQEIRDSIREQMQSDGHPFIVDETPIVD